MGNPPAIYRKLTQEDFHYRCAELLGCVEHIYKEFPFKKRTRWNNRTAGNGRYPGMGLIRVFGPKVHVSLRAPVQINKWFESKQDALNWLESLRINS